MRRALSRAGPSSSQEAEAPGTPRDLSPTSPGTGSRDDRHSPVASVTCSRAPDSARVSQLLHPRGLLSLSCLPWPPARAWASPSARGRRLCPLTASPAPGTSLVPEGGLVGSPCWLVTWCDCFVAQITWPGAGTWSALPWPHQHRVPPPSGAPAAARPPPPGLWLL